MNDLRTAAQQAMECLKGVARGKYDGNAAEVCAALEAALAQQAEPVQDQDVEDAIEAAYWQFDCRKNGLNEWASAPQSERDAFKAEARKLVRGYFPTRQAQDTKREMLAVAGAFIRGKRAALSQQAEPVKPVDVGLLEYRGNSVAFIHQKMTAYRTGIDAAWDALRANGLHPDGKTSLADMIAKHTAPPQQAEPVLQTCNCRWDGDVQVQQCTLHEAHVDAIHEWAERAKVAERKLAQQAEPVPMPPFPPVSQWNRGCAVCGIGADGKAYGYVCSRSDCPTKVTFEVKR